MARVNSPRSSYSLPVLSIEMAASSWPTRSAWKLMAKLSKGRMVMGFSPRLSSSLAMSWVRRNSKPPCSTPTVSPAMSAMDLIPFGLPRGTLTLIACSS